MAEAWTEANIATLKRLWSEGKSASQIANELACGVSRSAVIGKVHRLNLPKRANAGTATAALAKQAVRMKLQKPPAIFARARPQPPKPVGVRLPPRPPHDDETDAGVDVSALIGIMDLTNYTCRFPHGDPLKEGFGYCGKHTRQGSVYCEQHHRRVYPARAPL